MYDYSIFSVLAFPQRWQNDAVYRMPESGRPDCGFMYITDCENTIIADGEEIKAQIGQIVYLPMYAVYEAHFTGSPNREGQSGHITNYLLNFTLKAADGEPLNLSDTIRVFTPSDSKKLRIMFGEICEKSQNAVTPVAILKAEAYRIITEISKQIIDKNNSDGTASVLAKAMDYIGEHCLSGNISVSQLSKNLHVSESTLRRVFVSSLGMPPKDYINTLRLKRAILLIENGGIEICEVARLCGFEDSSYFSRFFKKHTGKTPTQNGDKPQIL